MKNLPLVIGIAVICATQASAQTISFNPVIQPQSVFGADPIMRVTSAFRTPLPMGDQQVPEMKLQDEARRSLYEIAAKECAVLSSTFKAECRIVSMNVSFPFTGPNTSPPNFATATVNYELRLGARPQ